MQWWKLAGLACAFPLFLHAQDVVIPTPKVVLAPQPVNVFVVARDKKGAPLANLTKADFSLQADRHAQTILTAEPAGGMPVTLGLLFDTSRIAPTSSMMSARPLHRF